MINNCRHTRMINIIENCTLEIQINVPCSLVAVTSAIRRGDEIDSKDPSRKIFFSEQPVTYLLDTRNIFMTEFGLVVVYVTN